VPLILRDRITGDLRGRVLPALAGAPAAEGGTRQSSSQSLHGLSVAKAPHVYRSGTEPVNPSKAVGAREMAEMPETVEPGETV
jgi:hypothetical protein